MRLSTLFLAAAALVLSAAPALAQASVTAQDLQYAEYSMGDGDPEGWFERTPSGQWNEYKTDGWRVHATFNEVRRAGQSVHLLDPTRGTEIELNLGERRIYLGGERSRVRRQNLYPIHTVASASTTEVEPGSAYRLTNSFLGTGRSLDTYSGDENTPFMGETGNYTGQRWSFTPLGDGTYRLTNDFLGAGRSLDTYSGDENTPFMGETGNYTGQRWRLTPIGEGYFRLTNNFLGAGRSLDTYSGEENTPFMGETGNFTGQRWRLHRLGR